jgi:hypothetical protein
MVPLPLTTNHERIQPPTSLPHTLHIICPTAIISAIDFTAITTHYTTQRTQRTTTEGNGPKENGPEGNKPMGTSQ